MPFSLSKDCLNALRNETGETQNIHAPDALTVFKQSALTNTLCHAPNRKVK